MDSVSFVSSRISDRKREDIREAREHVLAKAEKKAKKAAKEREKEKGWMLPNVEENLFSNADKRSKKSKKKKSHKEKKHKKEQKSKKKKRKRSSSSSSDSTSEDEWEEKPSSSSVKKHSERDSWMDMGLSLSEMSSSDRGPRRKEQKREEERRKEEENRAKLAQRELNPSVRAQHQEKVSNSNKSLEMIKRAVKRTQEQAQIEGKSVEEIAAKRWGSIEKYKEMLAKIENVERERRSPSREESSSSRAKVSSGWKTAARLDKDRSNVRSEIREEKRREVDAKDSHRNEKEPEPEKESKAPEEVQVFLMTDEEMNKLGSKIVKAEIMGDHERAKKLKEKLEAAREAKANAKNQPSFKDSKVEEETVILTRTDPKGMSRPVEADVPRSESRGKKGKVQTHNDGSRVRYFADDDRYDLKEMFHREKMSTAEDQNAMMSRLAGKAVEKTDDDDYSIDDVFVNRAARKRSEDQDKAKEREAAISEHKQMRRTLDTCSSCFDGSEFKKHLLVAVGKTCYVTLPWHYSLTEGHCFIVPMSHVKCSVLLDEDVFSEIQSFRIALANMFAANGQDCVFFECAKGLKRYPHMVLQCVPLPREEGEMAPMYFQKGMHFFFSFFIQKHFKELEQDLLRWKICHAERMNFIF